MRSIAYYFDCRNYVRFRFFSLPHGLPSSSFGDELGRVGEERGGFRFVPKATDDGDFGVR